jgi:acyl-CoA thioester hydrolase
MAKIGRRHIDGRTAKRGKVTEKENMFKTKIQVTVRFSDTDAMGHMNNSRFFSFMEEGRVAYFKGIMQSENINDAFKVFPFILAEIKCVFRAPVYCNDVIDVSLGVTKLGRKSFVMEYELHETKLGKLVATGDSVLVMYDYKTGQSMVIPDEFRKRVEAFEV